MQRGKDIAVKFPGLFLVHHNLPGADVKAHAHEQHHLIIPLQGEITVVTEPETMVCGPGRMAYIPPDTEHTFRSARDKGERLICMIDQKIWMLAEAGSYPASVIAASQLCKELLFFLLLHPRTKSPHALIDALIVTTDNMLNAPTIDRALSIDHLESSVSRPELKKAVAYAREHFADDLSVGDLARRSGLSLRNLNRQLQIALGMSPKQLIVAIRIQKAQTYLTSGSSVTEAAFAVGYHSLSQFIASFRQLTGQLPSEYAASGYQRPKPK